MEVLLTLLGMVGETLIPGFQSAFFMGKRLPSDGESWITKKACKTWRDIRCQVQLLR